MDVIAVKAGDKYKLFSNGQMIRNTPTWGTLNGARRWAVRNGYNVIVTQETGKTARILNQNKALAPVLMIMNGRSYEYKNRLQAIRYARSIHPDIEIIDETEDG